MYINNIYTLQQFYFYYMYSSAWELVLHRNRTKTRCIYFRSLYYFLAGTSEKHLEGYNFFELPYFARKIAVFSRIKNIPNIVLISVIMKMVKSAIY